MSKPTIARLLKDVFPTERKIHVDAIPTPVDLPIHSAGLHSQLTQFLSWLEQLRDPNYFQHTEIQNRNRHCIEALVLLGRCQQVAKKEILRHAWMLPRSRVKVLATFERDLWSTLLVPALNDLIFVDHGFDARRLEAGALCRLRAYLPARIHQQQQQDLNYYRAYLTEWGRHQEEPYLREIVNAALSSRYPFGIFSGKTRLRQLGLSAKEAHVFMQKAVRKQLLYKIAKIGRSHYYLLDPFKIKASRANLFAGDRYAPSLKQFRAGWELSRSRIFENLSTSFEACAESHLDGSPIQDEVTSQLVAQLRQAGIFTESKWELIWKLITDGFRMLPENYQWLSSHRQLLYPAMIQRRILYHVIAPLAASQQEGELPPAVSSRFEKSIRDFLASTLDQLQHFDLEQRYGRPEFTDVISKAYLPIRLPRQRRHIYRVVDAFLRPYGMRRDRMLTRDYAERVIHHFATRRGIRSRLEEEVTQVGQVCSLADLEGRMPFLKAEPTLLEFYESLSGEKQNIASFVRRLNYRTVSLYNVHLTPEDEPTSGATASTSQTVPKR